VFVIPYRLRHPFAAEPEVAPVNRERLAAILPPALGAIALGAAIFVLHRELASFHLADIEAELASIPLRDRLAAVALTIAGYGALTAYDALAFRWIRNALSYPRIAVASFVGFVFSHNIGLSFFGGNAVRYRILTTFGVGASDVGRVVTFNLLTFWLGFLGLGGITLMLDPITLPASLHLPFPTSRPIGAFLLAGLAIYLAASQIRRTPLRLGGLEVSLPRLPWTLAQVTVSMIDWALAAGVLYVLLPPATGFSFGIVLGAYLIAQVVALVSHVPGGLGVFEGVMVVLLRPYLPAHTVLGSVIAYRLVYYLAPLVFAVLLFGGHELVQRREAVSRGRDLLARWGPELIPRLFSIASLVAGSALLVSGATPAAAGRLGPLGEVVPLPLIELSHLLGSVVGVALLLLARALQQRIDAAYFVTLAALVAGAAASLAKGLDFEEATLLMLLFGALLPCRRAFYRRSSLVTESFSPAWTIGIALVILGTGVVTLFAYRHVSYSHDLWWQFELDAHAPRSLRALLAAALALGAFALARLLRPAAPALALPSAGELDALRPLVASSQSSEAHLALLGDKYLLTSPAGDGFVMYGIAGRSWIAMGDPIGAPKVRHELAWAFRELADAHGASASFYEVSEADLPVYLDLGLTLRKLGEEALVPLADFSLEGADRARLRQARNRMAREGCRFEMMPAESVAPLLAELSAISEEWLSNKHTREKRFSLGCFDEKYLARTPLAVIRRDRKILAFANVWAGGEHRELSIDLMRHCEDAPPTTMDALFTELMLWGRDQGYAWFSLGMAPLSGFEHHRLAPLWNRFGALLFRHGEHFYNFRGLREFKEKFDPIWRPRYLAAPGALSVPLVLTRVAALVNGGVSGMVAR
jgi:phosphatidylglycerol lysyltransferase